MIYIIFCRIFFYNINFYKKRHRILWIMNIASILHIYIHTGVYYEMRMKYIKCVWFLYCSFFAIRLKSRLLIWCFFFFYYNVLRRVYQESVRLVVYPKAILMSALAIYCVAIFLAIVSHISVQRLVALDILFYINVYRDRPRQQLVKFLYERSFYELSRKNSQGIDKGFLYLIYTAKEKEDEGWSTPHLVSWQSSYWRIDKIVFDSF